VTEYISFSSLPIEEPYYTGMCRLHNSIFIGRDADEIAVELAKKPKFLVLLAIEAGVVTGYKIGYEERADRFYSWLGGVHPEFRRRGIGSELMRRQHEWCRENGYRVIRTHTKNKWRDMLILNLRHGFDVIGTYTDAKGEPKIILEKKL
jgi:GNAT superfamily N-acetyltransferase